MSQLRGCAHAVIAAVVFSSALISVADAKQGDESAANLYRAATHAARPMVAPPKANAVPQTTFTFPEGSPDYHGSNGG